MNRTQPLIAALFATSVSFAIVATAHAGIPAQIIERFQSASNGKTPIGVTDGNPLAATAVFSTSMYRQLGFDMNQPKNFGFTLDGDAGQFTSGQVHSQTFGAIDLSFNASFGDKVGLLATIPIGYRETYDAKTYLFGFGVGLPITILDGDRRWVVSPWALIDVADGSDLAQGALEGGGGVTSLFSVKLNDATRLSMANQADYLVGQPIGYGSFFNFKQNVSQFIFKNGFELSEKLSDSWRAYGSVSYTNLMKDAFVDSYWTPELGVRFRVDHLSFDVSAFGDVGNHYSGYGVRASVSLDW